MSTMPAHQRGDRCFVCGRSKERHGAEGQHEFWSNADAMREADEYDRNMSYGYSSGATTAEAHYVETTRGR